MQQPLVGVSLAVALLPLQSMYEMNGTARSRRPAKTGGQLDDGGGVHTAEPVRSDHSHGRITDRPFVSDFPPLLSEEE